MPLNSDQIQRVIAELFVVMNRPQREDAFLNEAGADVDRALLTLLTGIHSYGPMRVGELATRVGRDYTTVSRQLTKLSQLGLVKREQCRTDARAQETTLTERGQQMAEALKNARARIMEPVLSRWPEADRDTLMQLMCRFVDDLGSGQPAHSVVSEH